MAGEIFISYRRADQDKARLLHALLKQRGVDAWYDAHVGAGEDWRHKTAEALNTAPTREAREALYAVLAEHPAKLVYCMPNFQNPSGISYAIPVRFIHELLAQTR